MHHYEISLMEKLKQNSIYFSFSVAIDDNSTEGKIDSICISSLFVSLENISLPLDCRFYLGNVGFLS